MALGSSSRNRSLSAGFSGGAAVARAAKRLDRSYVAGLELLDQRPGEGVADDLHGQHLLALDRVASTSAGSRRSGLVGHDDGVAAGERR